MMIELTMGESTAPPKPEPESAIEMARPRLAVNQLAETREMSRRVPATTTTPAMAMST